VNTGLKKSSLDADSAMVVAPLARSGDDAFWHNRTNLAHKVEENISRRKE